jgi:DNA-binding transcriptional LysR family regulator
MIDVAAIATLRAVSTHGSVVSAAQVLGFTPSAVSQQVKRLERQTGAQLLERFGRGVMLTEQGRRLVGEGGLILDALERLEAGLGEPHSSQSLRGSLRVAAFSTGVRGLLAPAMVELAREAPHLEITVMEQDPHEAVELVATGQVDVALAHNWADLPLPIPEHVEWVTLGVDRADVLVHADHPIAQGRTVTPAELVGERWACAPAGSVCHTWLTHLYHGIGATPDIRYWAGEFSSHVVLVEHGIAVSLVPRLGREILPAQVVAVPVTDPVPTRRVQLLWRRTMAPSPAIQELRATLQRVAARALSPAASRTPAGGSGQAEAGGSGG